MSMHEWNEVMYGIEFPNGVPSGNYKENVFNFLIKHRNEISEYTDFPTCPEEVGDFLSDYEDNYGNFGIEAVIGDVITSRYPALCVTTDDYGHAYAGLFALRHFPWEQISNHFTDLTEESVRDCIEPIIIELYGKCPEFEQHVIWYYG